MTNQHAEDEPGAGRVPEPEDLPQPQPQPGRLPEPEPLTDSTEPIGLSAATSEDATRDHIAPAAASAGDTPAADTRVEDAAPGDVIPGDTSPRPTVVLDAEPPAADEPPAREEPGTPFGGEEPAREEPGTPFGGEEPGTTPAWDEPRLAGGGFPPPGAAAPPPPPGTGGWATRYGLVRPAQGRVFAGVCAAFGRATNTDPVLWRVLLAVFTLAGGLGLLTYVLGWLFIPDEGDSASPIEALFGRGRSRANPVLLIVVAVGAAIGLGSVFRHNVPLGIIPFALIVVAIVMLGRRQNWNNTTGGYPPQVPPAGPGWPGTAGYQPPGATQAGPVPPAGGYPPPYQPQYRPASPGPVGYAAMPGGPAPQQAGYRPPFSPHGPYASTSPYPYPGLHPQAPSPVPPLAPVPPRPPAPRSRLGLVTFSLVLLTVGTVSVVALAGAHVPAAAYFAAALGAVGLGLFLGAWVGRARWLIAPGILLSLALAVAAAVPHVGHMEPGMGDINWAPTAAADVSSTYVHGMGNVTLDLTGVDFTDLNKTINVHINAGDLRVILPPKVDTTVQAKVDTGDASIFDSHWNGIGTPQRTVVNNGSDGPGGGRLLLIIRVNLGNLEVTR